MLTPLVDGILEEQHQQTKILQQCARMIDENRLKIHLNRTFPLKDAAEAHKLLGEGSMTGKIVLTMD
jgi:NADPH2:quinone reductase